jgi:hypothetical protein
VASTVEHHVRPTLSGEVGSFELDVTAHNRIVVERPTLWRPTTSPLIPAPTSGIFVPGPWNARTHPFPTLLTAIHHARESPGTTIVLVGHDEQGGKSGLGQARANGVQAILDNDSGAWVGIATDTGSLLDWHGYIDYLQRDRAWACELTKVDGVEDDASAVAIEGFQREYNVRFEASITEDGVCGTQTLGAIFAVLRFEWERWLDKHGLTPEDAQAVPVHIASAKAGHTITRDLDGSPGAPGLDVVVIDADRIGELDDGNVLYTSTLPRVRGLPVHSEPDGWEYGPYTLVLDIPIDEVMVREIYVLSSSDGEWEDRLAAPDDAIDTGLMELRFSQVPTDKPLDLRVEIDRQEPHYLFRGLKYGQLHLKAIGALDKEA